MSYNKPRQLTFGIDLDDTITQDPQLFRVLIRVIKDHGHQVYIVTARQPGAHCEISREFEPLVDGVIFCGTTAKADVAKIDIWIDDFPLSITHDFRETKWTPGKGLKENRYV